jgi:hypothetical protein
VPIFYSLAYHSMSYTKDDPNMCAKEFIEYLKKVGNIVTKEVSGQINGEVLRLTDDRHRRELMQAANLELVPRPPCRPSKAWKISSPISSSPRKSAARKSTPSSGRQLTTKSDDPIVLQTKKHKQVKTPFQSAAQERTHGGMIAKGEGRVFRWGVGVVG